MANQYLALVEETTRGTDPGSGYLFLPITGGLQPTFTPTDEPRKEIRGADTALGDSTVIRRESQWVHTIECIYHPNEPAIGLLLKHMFGKAATRAQVAASGAYEGIVYPLAMPYGTGLELGDTAIGIVPNTDEEGTTKSQYFGGGRITSMKVTIAGTDDVKLTFELRGAGEWIGTADQTAIASPVWASESPFCSSDVDIYINAGITRTGTAPDFTAIAEGTMDQFIPDSLEITITSGTNDKVVMNGIKGPSKTSRESQFIVEITSPIDYEDPSSGFSSAAEFKSLFSDTQTNSLLVIMDNGEVAGTASGVNFSSVIDIANLIVKSDAPERNSEGMTPSLAMSFSSLYSDTTEYPIAFLTTDEQSAY